ncbi:hypothetical protein GUJ93_ZPchr0009g879 [Zizania palustris]|uniref:Uncharacterized protein n=1 Tax=Zizania palustris TaxID=103762 RepID=A0A8J5RM50_ZIZPA|nr:hypothetical protein GUJ93_ZPchr0009g879 [Zizania palustris]
MHQVSANEVTKLPCMFAFLTSIPHCLTLVVFLQTARRRHLVPAFGEWNYYYGDETAAAPPPPAAAVAAEWYLYAYGAAEACSDVWFKYSTPPRRPTPTKAWRSEGRVAPERAPYVGGGKGRLQQQAGRAARAYEVAAGGPMARAPARGGGSCKVVRRAVDADLYQVPPPEFVSHRPRRRTVSNLWMGCLSLNCVA